MTTVTDNSIEQINAALLNLKKDIANGSLTEDKVKQIAASANKNQSINLTGYATKKFVKQYIEDFMAELPEYATKAYVDSLASELGNAIENLKVPIVDTYTSTSSPESVQAGGALGSYYRHTATYTISRESGIYKWINSLASSRQRAIITNSLGQSVEAIITNEAGDSERYTIVAGSTITTRELNAKWNESYTYTLAPTCITITWSLY